MKWDLSQLVEGTYPMAIEKKLESIVYEADLMEGFRRRI